MHYANETAHFYGDFDVEDIQVELTFEIVGGSVEDVKITHAHLASRVDRAVLVAVFGEPVVSASEQDLADRLQENISDYLDTSDAAYDDWRAERWAAE